MQRTFDDPPKRIRANGLTFAYHEAGDGPLALLLHGFPDTPRGWELVVPTLVEAGYRVVAPFMRGYAPTEVPSTRATILDELAADALALIEALGHRSAVLIGHDWGAATVYLATALAPERVDRLVAVGIPHPAALRPSARALWIGRHFVTLRIPGAAQRILRGDLTLIDTLYRRWSPTWQFGPEETAPVKECFRDLESLDAAIGYYRGFRPGLHQALRSKIEVPTLAVAGADDPAIPVEMYHAAARRFADYQVIALPGGHFVHRESPEGFADAVRAFLAA